MIFQDKCLKTQNPLPILSLSLRFTHSCVLNERLKKRERGANLEKIRNLWPMTTIGKWSSTSKLEINTFPLDAFDLLCVCFLFRIVSENFVSNFISCGKFFWSLLFSILLCQQIIHATTSGCSAWSEREREREERGKRRGKIINKKKL